MDDPDEWAAEDEAPAPSPGAKRPAHGRAVVPYDGITPAQADAMRRIAKAEVANGWEAVGVNFRSYEGRAEHSRLLNWIRTRMALHEGGMSKAWTTGIGAIVSAAVAGAIAYLTGSHK